LIFELDEAVKIAQADEEIKAIIMTGAGRAFSAGVDLVALNEGIKNGLITADEITQTGLKLIDRLQSMPKVTIAMVNGHCYTGAMELMMVFDVIVAADEAKIADTHAKWGILPKWGMSQRLPQLVGLLKAKELSYTCKPISGKEAERIGLVTRSVPLRDLEKTVDEMAFAIIKNSIQAIAAYKQLHHQGNQTILQKALKSEQAYNAQITDWEDFLRNFAKK
jgi:enoyl-CoA hydratase/carnithine racemase